MTFFDRAHVLNIAHRGARLVAPANTLAAFEKAAELGADGIEFDVHLSADGVPVVIHGPNVDETTDGTGPVSRLTLAQIKHLDAGGYFGPAFAGERIPTLEEVLATVGDRLLLNIELKDLSLRDTGLEAAVVALVERYGLADRVLFSSFNLFSLRRVWQLAPHIPRGLLYAPRLPLPLRRAWLAPLVPHEARHPQHLLADERRIAWARRHGYRVNVWTVNEPAEMRHFIALGVDGIITDYPDRLHSILAASR